MKRGFTLLMILCAVYMVLSCNKTPSYTDMLNDQKKKIDKLIADENLEILNNYPADSVFKENQFVKFDNGVYLNVIDSGNGNRAEMNKTIVLSRYTVTHYTDTVITYSNYGPNSNGTSPVEFRYGDPTAITGPVTSEYSKIMETFMSEGLQSALQYVGDQSKVKLIVPFQVGSSYDMDNGNPVYFRIVQFKFED